MPRLSILIPAFNARDFISQTINSVLAQTYTDWELIILEDRSTDSTLQIGKEYSAKHPEKIKVYQNEKNLGMLENWNKGISLCKSELFVKLDADDIWMPEFLQKSITILEKYPEVGLVFTKYLNIDERDAIISDSEIILPDFANEKPFSTIPLVQMGEDKMLSFPILRQGLSVMRRNIFEEIGKYRYLLSKETQAATDTEFYFRVGLHYKLYCINESLYKYRVHKASISRKDKDNQLSSQKIYEIKMSILKYYYEQGKIRKKEYFKNSSEVIFNYDVFLIQFLFKREKIGEAINLLIKSLFLNPIKLSTFYLQRLINRWIVQK